MAPSRRPPTRPVRSSRTKVQTYHEESTSGDESTHQSDSNGPSSRQAPLSLRPRNTARMPRSYREESTDASFPEILSDSGSDMVPGASGVLPNLTSATFPETAPDPGNPSRPSRPSRAQPTPRTRARTRTQQTKRPRRNDRELGRPLNKRKKVDTEEMSLVNAGVIPPWQTLPYQILFDIFLRASHPLVHETVKPRTPSVSWLVDVALLCRSFYEPALAALYYCPSLLPPYKSHGLLNLLSKPQGSLSMNYASKVKELHVDVETLLLYKSGPTLGYFELDKLIEKTPRLQSLRLYHKEDFIVGLPHWNFVVGLPHWNIKSKWVYPESIFSALEHSSISLRAWDWNGRFEGIDVLLPLMLRTHLQRAFRGLRDLRLLHIDEPAQEDSSERIATLAAALQSLPELERLEFLECTLVDQALLSMLPSKLHSLTLCNCNHVHSPAVASFLATHGGHLRELNLSHNRHLNMSFMKDLATSCGRLEKLKVDVSMHDWSTYHDIEPHFPHLICDGDLPTWPTTLQEIELIQLKKWDDAMAELFFTSLIDAAPTLRDLRRLVISAILKIGWRARASFREKWIGQLESVFLRQSTPPNPDLRSLRKRPLDPSRSIVGEGASAGDGTRPSAADAANANSAVQGRSKRQSVRLAQKLSEAEEEAESSAHATTPQPEESARSRPVTVQGMCEVVMIRIDNQRPTETQFNEDDFLDDELSGDEDWDGDDFEPAAGHAW